MLLRQIVTNWLHAQAADAARDAFQQGIRRQASSAEEAGSGEPVPPCDVGIVFALGIEAGGLLDRMQGIVRLSGDALTFHRGTIGDRTIVVVEGGAGRAKAAHATQILIDGHRPDWIISAGFAGGLTDALQRNDIVVPNQIALPEGHQLTIDLHLASREHLHVGRLLTVDAVVGSPDEKRRLAANHDAIAVDMETYAVAEVCAERKTRCFSVRIVSDGVDDQLPREVEHLLHQRTLSGKIGAVTGSLFRRPSSIKDLWSLKERAVVASDKLAEFLIGIVEQLPRSPRAESSSEPHADSGTEPGTQPTP